MSCRFDMDNKFLKEWCFENSEQVIVTCCHIRQLVNLGNPF